jgi:hypothetical protein
VTTTVIACPCTVHLGKRAQVPTGMLTATPGTKRHATAVHNLVGLAHSQLAGGSTNVHPVKD